MSRITHSLVGYDHRSERVVEEFHVPDTVLPRAKALAHVPDDDPDAIMCYPLDASGARDLANTLRATINTELCDFFLEGFAEVGASYEFADDAKFFVDLLEWSIWIHHGRKSGRKKDHIKVSVPRALLDDYACRHGHKDHSTVIDLLNERIKKQVQEIINRAIDNGRATANCLELKGYDLAAMLEG